MKVGDYGRLHDLDDDPVVELVSWAGDPNYFLVRDIFTGEEWRCWNNEITKLNEMEVLAWVAKQKEGRPIE